jgi:hypothetical protein
MTGGKLSTMIVGLPGKPVALRGKPDLQYKAYKSVK